MTFVSVKVLKEFSIVNANLNWNRILLHDWQNYYPPSNDLLSKIPSGVAELKKPAFFNEEGKPTFNHCADLFILYKASTTDLVTAHQ